MKPDLILLDCDGVIVDTEPTTNQALADNLGRYGLTLSVQDCMGLFVGGTMVGVGEKIRSMGHPLPDTWIDEIYHDMFTALKAGVDVFPGLFDFLDLADREGIPVCVLSNGPMAKMQITLGQHGLWDRFGDRIYSAYTKGNAKPDPGMVLDAMARFNATPHATWMVDDSKSGLTAGLRAGVQTFAFVPEGGPVPQVDFHHRLHGFADLSRRLVA